MFHNKQVDEVFPQHQPLVIPDDWQVLSTQVLETVLSLSLHCCILTFCVRAMR